MVHRLQRSMGKCTRQLASNLCDMQKTQKLKTHEKKIKRQMIRMLNYFLCEC